LGYKSLDEVESMILPEYLYRMKAHALIRVDREYDMHLQAWLNEQVGATKKQGKDTIPFYKSFDKFFNYRERIEAIAKPRPKVLKIEFRRMAQLAAKSNSK